MHALRSLTLCQSCRLYISVHKSFHRSTRSLDVTAPNSRLGKQRQLEYVPKEEPMSINPKHVDLAATAGRKAAYEAILVKPLNLRLQ